MKKYVKPELYYENFELSQHIAACGIDVNQGDTGSCTPTLAPKFWGGMNDTVFNSGESRCATSVDAIDVYCYTVGTSEAGKLFNS